MAVLDVIEEDGLLKSAAKVGADLKEHLLQLGLTAVRAARPVLSAEGRRQPAPRFERSGTDSVVAFAELIAMIECAAR
jgi:hypothetical protein